VDSISNMKADTLHSHNHSDITDFHMAVKSIKINEMTVPTSALHMNDQIIANLANPINS
jgi:hypothetical protein